MPVASGNFRNPRFHGDPSPRRCEGRGVLPRRPALRPVPVDFRKTRTGDSPAQQGVDGGSRGDEPVLEMQPSPYRALVWIMKTSAGGECGYLGNPVRHFQHLASRMTGPRAEIRSWRAWVCFHLAEILLDGALFPRDGEQIAREGIWIPGMESVAAIFREWAGNARRGSSGKYRSGDRHLACSSFFFCPEMIIHAFPA